MKIAVIVSDCTPDQAAAIASFLASIANVTSAQVDQVAAELEAKMYPAAPRGIPASNDPGTPQVAPANPPAPPPAAPKAPTPPAAPAGELDVRGVPWHGAHHAGSKGKNQDGTWKRLKGTDKNVVAAYEAQFTGRPNGPSSGGVPAVTPSAPATIPPAVPVDTSAGVPIHAYAPPAPPAPPAAVPLAPPPPPPAAPAPDVDYGTFYTLYIRLCEATALDEPRVAEMNRIASITDVNQYNTDPAKRAIGYRYMQGLEAQLAA